jgi:hypothetical protein
MEKFKDRPPAFCLRLACERPKTQQKKTAATAFSRRRTLAVLGLLLLVGVSQTP